MNTTSIYKIIAFFSNFDSQSKEYVGNSLHLNHQNLNLGLALHNLDKARFLSSIPSSSKIGFASSKMISCKPFEAPTTNCFIFCCFSCCYHQYHLLLCRLCYLHQIHKHLKQVLMTGTANSDKYFFICVNPFSCPLFLYANGYCR